MEKGSTSVLQLSYVWTTIFIDFNKNKTKIFFRCIFSYFFGSGVAVTCWKLVEDFIYFFFNLFFVFLVLFSGIFFVDAGSYCLFSFDVRGHVDLVGELFDRDFKPALYGFEDFVVVIGGNKGDG